MDPEPDSPLPPPAAQPEESPNQSTPAAKSRDRDPDPEIDALLDFDPVYRRIKRSDGWPPEVQRGFIAALARTGSVEHAAFAVHRSDGGAWKLRGHGSGQSFAAAWDGAIDLYHQRNPKPARRGGRARGAWAEAAKPAAPPEGWVHPDQFFMTPQEFGEKILKTYWAKLRTEREARLDGRIVEADFIVRQMTWLEVAIDCLGGAADLLEQLKRNGVEVGNIAATPWSLYFDTFRRACWRSMGEPDRPPLAPLGRCVGDVSTGEATDRPYGKERDPLHLAVIAERAEAQRLWEEKAKAEAAAWRERVESEEKRGGAAAYHKETKS